MSDSKVLSEATILAGVSGVSYAAAYAYQTGYAAHFSLPPLMVSPTIGSVLQAAAALSVLLVAAFVILNLFWWTASLEKLTFMNTAFKRATARFLCLFLATEILIYPLLDSTKFWINTLSAFITGIVLQFVLPAFKNKAEAGFDAKLLAAEQPQPPARRLSLLGFFVEIFGSTHLIIGGASLAVIVYALLLGLHSAEEKQVFLVPKNSPGYVVALMDDSLYVLASYDPATQTLTGNYRVEKFSEGQQHDFKREYVGRLLPPPKPKSLIP